VPGSRTFITHNFSHRFPYCHPPFLESNVPQAGDDPCVSLGPVWLPRPAWVWVTEFFKKQMISQAQWLMPVILATQETKTGRTGI
jgi:hypothetical protein